jgi:putative phosphoesterase
MTKLCVGLIADTHGLLRPQALVALEGCEAILHAGDVGDLEVLEALAQLAPVTAVRGNCDDLPQLPWSVTLSLLGHRLVLHHGHLPLSLELNEEDIVISGHTHVPLIQPSASGLPLRINPGSAGPRRFRLPVTVARLQLGQGAPQATLVELDLGP